MMNFLKSPARVMRALLFMMIGALIVFLYCVFMAPPAQAQATANAASQSGSQAASLSGSSANNQIVFQSGGKTISDGKLETVPSVYAPSVSGGAHPCLSGGSAGLSVMGGGLSGGLSDAEPICMLAFLGQQEAAIRALAASDPKACRALNNVGYYVVPAGGGTQKVVPFKCEREVKRGGAFTAGVSTRTVSTNSGAASVDTGLAECRKTANNGVKIKYKYNANKAAAKAACLASLGY